MQESPKRLGTVYLIGGGPGDPGLLTLRAVECLRMADVVVYDQLVSPRALDYVPAGAERICVRDLAGFHPDRWPHIHQTMVDAALAGKTVVRLKGGDPNIFGRGGEEAETLRIYSIPYEIVPGVTAALASGSYLEIPLTHRAHASALALVTGHENPTKGQTRLDWEALAKFPGTLAIYMGIARLPLIVGELVKYGMSDLTPACIIYKATTGHQLSVTAPLKDLDEERRRNGIDTPALVIIGAVVGLKPEKSWFEQRPLLNQRILVTRPRDQSVEMIRRLELLGAVPYLMPAIEIREPADWEPVDQAIDRLQDGAFDWLVFTSANGVQAFIGRILSQGRDLRVLGGVKLAAVGPATADALQAVHLRADLVPEDEYRAEALAKKMGEVVEGQRVLLARADRGRDVLRKQLDVIANVEQVIVYSQVDAVDPKSEWFDYLRRGEIDLITLTSSNIARSVLRAFDDTIKNRIQRGDTRIVTMSPITSETVREMGFPVSAEANPYTVEGVIQAVLDLVSSPNAAPADDGVASESLSEHP